MEIIETPGGDFKFYVPGSKEFSLGNGGIKGGLFRREVIPADVDNNVIFLISYMQVSEEKKTKTHQIAANINNIVIVLLRYNCVKNLAVVDTSWTLALSLNHQCRNFEKSSTLCDILSPNQ